MAAVLLSFREGLEATLLIGIVLGYLNRTGQAQRVRFLWAGVIVAAALSVSVAVLLFAIGAELAGTAEAVFEAATLLLATAVLTWMIFWMQDHGREVKGKLESSLGAETDRQSRWGLFSLSFIAVAREGIELALFLTAAVFASSALQTLTGAIIGLALAVIAGWMLFAGSRRLDMRRFFTVTGVLLIIFAAGMVGRSIYELAEAGLVPTLIDHVWNLKSILPDTSTVGSILQTLVGYTDDPSLLQVLAHAGYAVVVLLLLVGHRQRAGSSEQGAASRQKEAAGS
jgi:high-affinity iron transporter